jgi:tight adherence protein B
MMLDDPIAWAGCVVMGLAVAVLVFTGRDAFGRAMNAVERDLAEKLRRLRVSSRHLRTYLVVWISVTIATLVVLWVVFQSIVFGVLAASFLLLAPWYLLRRMAERHRMKVEDQLADAMVTLANAVRAGLSLAQSMEILAAQCPKPINAEFHQIVAEYKLGKPIERTLVEAKERLRSENFALFAAAMMASHESGGRLNETVERISESVREMQRLDRKIMAETAQARKSAIYMAMAPGIILVAYFFVDPVNTSLLFTRMFGQILLAVVVVLNVLAYFWARVILNPDI